MTTYQELATEFYPDWYPDSPDEIMKFIKVFDDSQDDKKAEVPESIRDKVRDALQEASEKQDVRMMRPNLRLVRRCWRAVNLGGDEQIYSIRNRVNENKEADRQILAVRWRNWYEKNPAAFEEAVKATGRIGTGPNKSWSEDDYLYLGYFTDKWVKETQ